MSKTLIIDGAAIRDIPSFYDEINRVFMTGETWKLGASLDALNDMFHGGYGAIEGDEPVTLIWRDMERNRADLGIEATREFYRRKLERPEIFDVERVARDLDALEAGAGPTFFDIVLQVLADHPNIALVAR